MTQNEIVSYWIKKAQVEIKSANIMYKAKQYLYTGFMCHQSIEKALKAYYIFLNDEIQPHDHNLDNLIKITGLADKLDGNQKLTIKKLIPLYIKTRYEDYKNDISSLLTKPYCKTLLSETGELLKWIIRLMR